MRLTDLESFSEVAGGSRGAAETYKADLERAREGDHVTTVDTERKQPRDIGDDAHQAYAAMTPEGGDSSASGTTLVRHSDINVRISLAEEDKNPSGRLAATEHDHDVANLMTVLATNAIGHIG